MIGGEAEPLCTVTVEDTTIRAVDRANTVVEIGTVGWDPHGPAVGIPYPMDATISGRATRLSITSTNVTVSNVDEGTIGDRTQIEATEPYEIPTDGGALLSLTGPITTWIRFDGAATIEQATNREIRVSFPHPTPVTVGFRSQLSVPAHTVTVEPTPAGVATALSHFGATIVAQSPRRASILYRGHPPRIAFGDEDVPEALRTSATDTGIELHLPATFDALFPAASLATYLGASVRVDDGVVPTLRAPAADLVHEFSRPPTFQSEAAATLRRCYYLDSLVGWLQRTNFDWLEADALVALDLDPDAVAQRPLAERVARYLAVDFELVSPIFPDWLHNARIEPTADNARTLPYLAANLTRVSVTDDGPTGAERRDIPEGEPSPGRRRSEPDDRSNGPAPNPREPYVARFGDGPRSCDDPLDGAYRASLAAYRNRQAYLGDRDDISVLVVLAGGDRTDRFDRLLDEYRVDRPTLDLAVVEAPTRDELAVCLSDGVDLLHVVGDCRGGLPCADGTLEPADLPPHAVRTFFLDGPGGRETADDLIAAGSVAGAVLEPAANGGSPDGLARRFLRGFVGGFGVDVAARWAGALSDGPARLSVVGDGLYELADFDEIQVLPLEAEPMGNRQFRVRIPTLYPDPGTGFGGLSLERWQFVGTEFDLTLSADGLATLLSTRWYLVVTDGELHRPDAVEPFAPSF